MEAIDLPLKMDPSEGQSKQGGGGGGEEEDEHNGGEIVDGDNDHNPEVKEGCSDEARSGVEVATAEANDAEEVEGGRGGDGLIHLPVPQQQRCDKYELNELQEEMNRIKEENNALRKFVDQTMKEYCDLQMRVALIQQANIATDHGILLSLAGNPSGEQTVTCNSTGKLKERAPSPSGGDGDELELSLRLQTTTTGGTEEPVISSKDSREDNRMDMDHRNKMPRIDAGGLPSMSSLISTNRSKARVSVRARVEGATVSLLFSPPHPSELGISPKE
ncbi:hypothetical protein SAY87_018817 [Trapa incisa]|uniref:Uncharacterized protein n=1 Tax=Trapa incisa TaxID=236973 RepID=A0AAN7Q0X5_9MYRT|nr:hypothetical protein SAY87_018817 [Trapa incisa]